MARHEAIYAEIRSASFWLDRLHHPADIHPGEESDGNLGMSSLDEDVLTLTLSGATTELDGIIAFSCHFGAKLMVVTSHRDSTPGLAANICLTLPQVRVAWPNQLAATSLTTAQMVSGNAIG